MLSCWNAVPTERPTFTEITKMIQDFLSNNDNENEQINLNVLN